VDNPQTGLVYWVQKANNKWAESEIECVKAAGAFSNLVGRLCPTVVSGSSSPIPVDGLADLTLDVATNCITKSGFDYDASGNQTEIVRPDGIVQ